jgi:hypothetical protein
VNFLFWTRIGPRLEKPHLNQGPIRPHDCLSSHWRRTVAKIQSPIIKSNLNGRSYHTAKSDFCEAQCDANLIGPLDSLAYRWIISNTCRALSLAPADPRTKSNNAQQLDPFTLVGPYPFRTWAMLLGCGKFRGINRLY